MKGEFKKPGDFSGFTLEHSLETPPLLHPGGFILFYDFGPGRIPANIQYGDDTDQRLELTASKIR